MNSSSKVLVALIAGVALGASLGVLFAPDKGTDVRRKIGDQARKATDSLRHTTDKIRQKADDLRDKAKDKAERFANETEANYERGTTGI